MIDALSAYDTEHGKAARTPIYQLRIQATPGANVPTPIGYWNLNESDGVRSDSIGTNHLTDNNTVGATSGGTLGTWAQFIAANSEYLSHVDNATLSTGNIDFTIVAWVQLDTKPSEGDIVSKDDGASQREFNLRYMGGGTDRFNFFASSTGANTASVSADAFGAVSIGVRYMVVAWHDSVHDLIGISVNAGTASTAVYPGGVFNSTSEFDIGRSVFGAGTYWDGKIGPVGFWKTVLTSEQISYLYNNGIGRTFDNILAISTYDFCTSKPITGDNLGLEVLAPLELNQRAEIERSRFPLTTLTVELQDINGAVTAIVSTGLEGHTCQLYYGFYDAWSPMQRFGGVVTEIEYNSGRYKLTARSPMVVAQDKQIFNAAQTQLTADVSSVATSIGVVSTAAFDVPGTNDPWGDNTIYLAIDNEVLFFASSTATSFGAGGRVGTFRFIAPPELPGSESVAHNNKAAVRELVLLGALTINNDDADNNNLHPIDLLTVVFTDTNPKFALNTSILQLNTTELAAARTTLGSQLKFRFIHDAPLNAKKFLEEELYKCLAGYPTEDELGRIGIKLYQAGVNATTVGTITDADIVDFPRWVRNAENRINKVILRYDYNPITREFMSAFEYKDTALIAQHGRELPLSIDSKGIRGSVTGGPLSLTWFGATAAFLTSMAQRHIARFGNRAPILAVSTLFSKQLYEVGDDVSCTFSYVPNLDTAEKSITNRVFEIMSMRHNFRTGLIDMELLGYPDA